MWKNLFVVFVSGAISEPIFDPITAEKNQQELFSSFPKLKYKIISSESTHDKKNHSVFDLKYYVSLNLFISIGAHKKIQLWTSFLAPSGIGSHIGLFDFAVIGVIQWIEIYIKPLAVSWPQLMAASTIKGLSAQASGWKNHPVVPSNHSGYPE